MPNKIMHAQAEYAKLEKSTCEQARKFVYFHIQIHAIHNNYK